MLMSETCRTSQTRFKDGYPLIFGHDLIKDQISLRRTYFHLLFRLPSLKPFHTTEWGRDCYSFAEYLFNGMCCSIIVVKSFCTLLQGHSRLHESICSFYTEEWRLLTKKPLKIRFTRYLWILRNVQPIPYKILRKFLQPLAFLCGGEARCMRNFSNSSISLANPRTLKQQQAPSKFFFQTATNVIEVCSCFFQFSKLDRISLAQA